MTAGWRLATVVAVVVLAADAGYVQVRGGQLLTVRGSLTAPVAAPRVAGAR